MNALTGTDTMMTTDTSPLRQLVADLLKRVGAQRAVALEVPIDDLCAGVVAVPSDSPVTIDLMLERIPEGIVARGTLSADWHADCARCLGSATGHVVVGVDELFETEPEGGETYLLDVDTIDLDPLVRDALVLELPQSPLCRPDCAGLCPQCGVDRNTVSCDCTTTDLDPRWAALQSLDPEPS